MNLALSMFGKAMSLPLVFGTLRKLVKPHVHLFDLDGSMYMGRWSVVDEFVRVNNRDTAKRTWAGKRHRGTGEIQT